MLTLNHCDGIYQGKVRDVYTIQDRYLVLVASNRISAFDVILPREIPYKGQVLNQLAAHFLEKTKHIVPNWLIKTVGTQASIGYKADAYPVEMVVRGYLVGHAWRTYNSGLRTLCGVELPEGLQENQKLPHPIITPTTKAQEGHDMDISREEIIARGIVPQDEYEQLEKYTLELYDAGVRMASERGLILVDTKFEFGKVNGHITLIDEILTPDSSRYFYADGYEDRLASGVPQKQLSKEFVREWLMANGFQGKEGQEIPLMSDTFVQEISDRYIELYEKVTGLSFQKENIDAQKLETLINSAIQEIL